MKNVNFLTTLSPEQQYEIRRWYISSLFLFIGMVIAISYFLVPQLYLLHATKNEIKRLQKLTINYDELLHKKSELKKESELLQKKRTKLTSYRNQPQSPYEYVVDIAAACDGDIVLEQVRTNKKSIELIVLCESSELITGFIKKLSETGRFGVLKLVSLHNDAQIKKLRCVVKGAVK